MKKKRILAMLVRMDERLERAAEVNDDMRDDVALLEGLNGKRKEDIDLLGSQNDRLMDDNHRLSLANAKMSDELAEKELIIVMIKADHENLRKNLQGRLDEVVKLATAAQNERDKLKRMNENQANTIRTIVATHPNYSILRDSVAEPLTFEDVAV